MLPNFLCIGTQRAATTWLFNCLKEHPDVFVPEIKEVDFFLIKTIQKEFLITHHFLTEQKVTKLLEN